MSRRRCRCWQPALWHCSNLDAKHRDEQLPQTSSPLGSVNGSSKHLVPLSHITPPSPHRPKHQPSHYRNTYTPQSAHFHSSDTYNTTPRPCKLSLSPQHDNTPPFPYTDTASSTHSAEGIPSSHS